jgi:hypothetical protein
MYDNLENIHFIYNILKNNLCFNNDRGRLCFSHISLSVSCLCMNYTNQINVNLVISIRKCVFNSKNELAMAPQVVTLCQSFYSLLLEVIYI